MIIFLHRNAKTKGDIFIIKIGWIFLDEYTRLGILLIRFLFQNNKPILLVMWMSSVEKSSITLRVIDLNNEK